MSVKKLSKFFGPSSGVIECISKCSLKKEDQHILLSKDAWLIDRIMDAAQKLICKEIGNELSYQSVLNSQKEVADPFHPVTVTRICLLINVQDYRIEYW